MVSNIGMSTRWPNQVVVGGLRGIGAVLAEAEHAGIDQARVDLRYDVIAEIEPRHRLRPHVVNQHVRGFDQPQHGFPSRRLLQVEADRALVAIGVQKHRPHTGMPERADQTGNVALERLHLDDIGAVVAEHLGRIGPHQHGRHVDDLDALQRAHDDVRSLMLCTAK
jgi:hypothetical protein